VKRKLFLASLEDSPESPPQVPAAEEEVPADLPLLTTSQSESILPRIASCPAQLDKSLRFRNFPNQHLLFKIASALLVK
jgi:hypothetical protein